MAEANIYTTEELRELSAELAAGMPLTAEVFVRLKATVKSEIGRRKYSGEITEYASDDWDYTISPSGEAPVLLEHYSKLQTPLDVIKPIGLALPLNEKPSLDLSGLANRLADNIETDRYSGNDCVSNCTGLCSSTCWKSCGTACSSTCSGGCSSECSSSCVGGCKETCNTTCDNTCKTTCSGGCVKNCGGGCSTGCGSTCTESCTNSCAGQCVGCTGSCKSGCTGTCNTTCSGCTGTCSGSCHVACAITAS